MQNTPARGIPALAATDLTKVFAQRQRTGKVKDLVKNLIHPETRKVTALNSISLTVNHGEFVAYAGANGAGKSTTIKLLSGILQPTGGKVLVLGKNPARHRVELMRRVGVLFGNRSELWWDFPVQASFAWKKQVWDIDDVTYNRMLATAREMLGLDDILHTYARELSLGQRMRADLGMLLLHDPQIIFLDEPTLGLDVLAKQQLIAFLRHINKTQGTTILVTSHDMDDLHEMADRIVLLSHGQVAYDGGFENLRALRKDKATVHVTTKQQNPPPIPWLKLEGYEHGALVYSYDAETAGMAEVLQSLSALPDIQDIEIKKAPIEDVIAGLYKSWA